MSVGAFINNPANEKERKFGFPISSEKFFNSYWLPASELLNLRWIPCFSPGIDVYQKDVSEIMAEINKLKTWALENMKGEELEYMIERIDLLTTQLPLAFTRDGVSVFIG